MKKKTYYLDGNDFVYCEMDGKLYAYNYVKKTFTLTDDVVDPMTFHSFPESELEESIKISEHLFK